MLRDWRDWRARRAVNYVAAGNELNAMRGWKLNPGARLYLDLDNCFVNVYNRVPRPGDPRGATSIFIETRPGYVLGSNNNNNVLIEIRDPRNEPDSGFADVNLKTRCRRSV